MFSKVFMKIYGDCDILIDDSPFPILNSLIPKDWEPLLKPFTLKEVTGTLKTLGRGKVLVFVLKFYY